MHITAQGWRLLNDLYCVEWDVKLYYTIPSGLTPDSQLTFTAFSTLYPETETRKLLPSKLQICLTLRYCVTASFPGWNCATNSNRLRFTVAEYNGCGGAHKFNYKICANHSQLACVKPFAFQHSFLQDRCPFCHKTNVVKASRLLSSQSLGKYWKLKPEQPKRQNT